MRSNSRLTVQSLVLAVGTFAVGTDASVIAGVLPGIGADLRVGPSSAGQLVTVFAIAYAVLAPVLAVLTGAWGRRRVLIGALGVFVLGNIMTAIAPTYGLVLAARIMAAAGAALYTPAAMATIAALAGSRDRSRAMSTVVLGLTLSSAVGVPVGSFLGSAVSWRDTMWFLAGLGTVAMVAVGRLARAFPLVPRYDLGERVAPLRDRRVLLLLAVTITLFTAAYSFYSYISIILMNGTGGSGYRLAFILLVSGSAGTVGNLLSGSLVDRFGGRSVLVVVSVLMAVNFALMPIFGRTYIGALVAAACYGLSVWAITVPQQQALIACVSSTPTLVISLNVSGIYVAAALGSVAGGAILRFGPTAVTAFAAVLAGIGLVLSETAHRVRSGRDSNSPVLI